MLPKFPDLTRTLEELASSFASSFSAFSTAAGEIVWSPPPFLNNVLATTSLLEYAEHAFRAPTSDSSSSSPSRYSYEDSDYEEAADWLSAPWEGAFPP